MASVEDWEVVSSSSGEDSAGDEAVATPFLHAVGPADSVIQPPPRPVELGTGAATPTRRGHQLVAAAAAGAAASAAASPAGVPPAGATAQEQEEAGVEVQLRVVRADEHEQLQRAVEELGQRAEAKERELEATRKRLASAQEALGEEAQAAHRFKRIAFIACSMCAFFGLKVLIGRPCSHAGRHGAPLAERALLAPAAPPPLPLPGAGAGGGKLAAPPSAAAISVAAYLPTVEVEVLACAE
eukprot:scaffold30.g4422.t1